MPPSERVAFWEQRVSAAGAKPSPLDLIYLADAYLEATGIDRGESVAFLAPCGPGSFVIARVDEDARVLGFDAVTFGPDDGDHLRPTARAAIRRVARAYAWISDCEEEAALGTTPT